MPKFTLTCEHDDGTVVTHQLEKDYLPEVLESVDLFLRGCGYYTDGYLDYVSDGDFRDSELVNLQDDCDHSMWYNDVDRNRPIQSYNQKENSNG
jgi:hypothetical protein